MTSNEPNPNERVIIRPQDFPAWPAGIEHSFINFYREERRWLRLRMRQEVCSFFKQFVLVRGEGAKGWKVSSMLVPEFVDSKGWDTPLEQPEEAKATGSTWVDDRPIYRVHWCHYYWSKSINKHTAKIAGAAKSRGRPIKGFYLRGDTWESRKNMPRRVMIDLGMGEAQADRHQACFEKINRMNDLYLGLRQELDGYIAMVDKARSLIDPLAEEREDRGYQVPWSFTTRAKKRGGRRTTGTDNDIDIESDGQGDAA